MLKVGVILSCFSAILLAHAQAGVSRHTPRVQKQIFECNYADCSLREFKLQSYDYETSFKGKKSYGTSATMSFKTRKVDQLKDYAVVQFIKGCQFYSYLEDGEVKKRLGTSREYFNDFIKFKHTEWMIDSVDEDPMYNSMRPQHRHGAYRWNKNTGSYMEEGESYVLHAPAEKAELYVKDLPGVAFKSMNTNAKNISLEFKSCLYKTEEIPLETHPLDLHFADPIHCFEWKSSHIYDHKKEKYESRDQIDPYCLR